MGKARFHLKIAFHVRNARKDGLEFFGAKHPRQGFSAALHAVPTDDPGDVSHTKRHRRRLLATNLWRNATVEPKTNQVEGLAQVRQRVVVRPVFVAVKQLGVIVIAANLIDRTSMR